MNTGHVHTTYRCGQQEGESRKDLGSAEGGGASIKPGPELGKAVECRVERQVPVKFCGAKKMSLISGRQGKIRMVPVMKSYRRGASNQNFEPDQRSGLS